METNNLPSFFVERNYAFSFSSKHQTKLSKKPTCPPKKKSETKHPNKKITPPIKISKKSYTYPLNKNQTSSQGGFLLNFAHQKTNQKPTLPRFQVDAFGTPVPSSLAIPDIPQVRGGWVGDGWLMGVSPKMDGEHSWKTRN